MRGYLGVIRNKLLELGIRGKCHDGVSTSWMQTTRWRCMTIASGHEASAADNPGTDRTLAANDTRSNPCWELEHDVTSRHAPNTRCILLVDE